MRAAHYVLAVSVCVSFSMLACSGSSNSVGSSATSGPPPSSPPQQTPPAATASPASLPPQAIELAENISQNRNAQSYRGEIERVEVTRDNLIIHLNAKGGPDLRHPSGSCLFDLATGKHIAPFSVELEKDLPGDYKVSLVFPRLLMERSVTYHFVYSCSLDYTAVLIPFKTDESPSSGSVREKYLAGLDPRVRSGFENQADTLSDRQRMQLLEFLYDASRNRSPLPGFGLPTVMIADSPQFRYQGLTPEAQLEILANKTYAFLDPNQLGILIVASATDGSVSSANFSSIMSTIKSNFSTVQEYMNVPYRYRYIHVNVIPDSSTGNHGDGANLFIRPTRIEAPSIIVHELAHAFQTTGAPRWWREASADQVTRMVTGIATYEPFSTGERIMLNEHPVATTNRQVASAVALLARIHALIGTGPFVDALGDLNSRDITSREAFDSLIAHAGETERAAVRSAICSAVINYC